jgi:hypothetical protein
MSKNCPLSGECIRASICEGFDDESRIIQLLSEAPETQEMKDVLSEEELLGLMRPVLSTWGSANCFKERVRALKELQFTDDISHVSITLGLGVVEKLEESQFQF